VPTYGYECTACKEQFEVIQRMTDDALAIHEGCGGELRRLLYPVGIMFKGPGFHVNDYGPSGKKPLDAKKPSAKDDGKSTSESKDGKTESATTSTTEPKAEPKSAASTPKPD
jgi:putative FmdB family regulatory protein